MEIINHEFMKKALKDYDEIFFITIKNHKFLKKSLKVDDEFLFVCISVHFCTKTCNKVYKILFSIIAGLGRTLQDDYSRLLIASSFYVKRRSGRLSIPAK